MLHRDHSREHRAVACLVRLLAVSLRAYFTIPTNREDTIRVESGPADHVRVSGAGLPICRDG